MRLTSDVHGWTDDLSGDEILTRLVALNDEQPNEPADHVRWLRPDYLIPRSGKKVAARWRVAVRSYGRFGDKIII